MKSVRFGVLVIAICGVLAFAAAIRVGIWGGQAEALAEQQEEIGDHIVLLRNSMKAMKNLEDGQRGYLLTGQDAYLQPYEAGRRALGPTLQRLADAYSHDAEILAKIEDLRRLGREKQQELQRTIELRRGGSLGDALDIVRSGEGKRLMEAYGAEMDGLLNQFRAARSVLVTAEIQTYHKAALVGAAVLLLIVVMVVSAIAWLSASIKALDALQRQREREAMHDSLTALPNRRYLRDWLGMALPAAQRSGRPLMLLYFDLDGFKGVNDRHGHEAGDRVLQATAARLRGAMRSSDFVARLGGDEFVAVLPDAPGDPALSGMLDRLHADLAKAAIPELADGEVGASIGLARYPADGTDADALLGAADHAMYLAKQQRRRARAGSAAPPLAVAAGG